MIVPVRRAELQLYHYKARVYDPLRGRFLQTDPLGYQDDLNLYQYVRNDPLSYVDPSGMQSCPQGQSRPPVALPPRADRDAMRRAIGRSRQGAIERGGHMLRNPETGETSIVLPPDSGHGDTENFYHSVPAEDSARQVLAFISHTHNPADTRSPSAARQSQENNAPSVDDQVAMNDRGVAIQVIGPDVSGTLYRDDSGQDYFAVETGDISRVPDLSAQQIIVVDERERR